MSREGAIHLENDVIPLLSLRGCSRIFLKTLFDKAFKFGYCRKAYQKTEACMSRLSNTNQRRVIIEELRKLKTHPTADELYEIVRARIPSISLGTVYRNLEVLSDYGEILKLEFAGKQRRFDGDVRRHCHLRCIVCGAVEDIDMQGVESIEQELDKFVGGRIRAARLDFSGYCVRCAAKIGIGSVSSISGHASGGSEFDISLENEK